MKRTGFLLISVVLTISAYSQRSLSDKQWIEDLDFMSKRLDSIHPNPYTHIQKEPFLIAMDQLKEKIPVYTDDEVIAGLLRIITLIGDGHTRLHGNNLTRKWYPVRIEQFSDGYYITACPDKYSKFITSKVIRVNNHPVEEVFTKIMSVVPHDNEYGQRYFLPMFFMMSSVLSGLHFSDGLGDLTLLIENAGHQQAQLHIEAVDYRSNEDLGWYWRENGVPGGNYVNIMSDHQSSLPLYLKHYNKPFWYEHIQDKNAVYFGFNECSGNDDFEGFNKDLWRCIDSCRVEYLIIDLRNNFGGTNSILEPLIQEIIKHDHINRKGHLFVITGGKTFSAAMHCATWIEYHCDAIFAGQPTGSSPNHFADPDFSFLPNSKILLMISKYYWQNSWPWDNRQFIEPELNISLNSNDYFNYRDPVMEAVFRLIEEK